MIFGLAGFKDSSRLFTKVDVRLVQAQKMLAEAEQKAKAVIDQHKDRLNARERAGRARASDRHGRQRAARAHEPAARDADGVRARVAQGRERNGNRTHKAQNDIEIARMEAAEDTRLKRYEANVDAEIAKFKAKVQAAKRN
jgi:hypothetical protein